MPKSKANSRPAKSKPSKELTEAQIAVHWKEEEYFYPTKEFKTQANLVDSSFIKKFSEKNFPKCFDAYANLLDWDKKWKKTLDTSNPPFWKWFGGGRLNVSYNCVDRHLAEHKNKAAFIFVPEPENETAQVLTYRELYVRVNETAVKLVDSAPLIPAVASSSTLTATIATENGSTTRATPTSPSKRPKRKASTLTKFSSGAAILAIRAPNRLWSQAATSTSKMF